MKKVILLVCLGFFFSVVPDLKADQGISGLAYLRDGRQIKAETIQIQGMSDKAVVFMQIDGLRYRIPPHQLISLNFRETTHYNGRLSRPSEVLVTLENSKTATADYIDLSEIAQLTFKDSLTGGLVTQSFVIRGAGNNKDSRPADIVRIDFMLTEKMNYSKSSKMYFPLNYAYDPFTGEKLETVVVNQSEAANSGIHTPPLNISESAGAVNDEFTRKALDYAKAMVNPLATQDDISRALNNFRKEAEKTFE